MAVPARKVSKTSGRMRRTLFRSTKSVVRGARGAREEVRCRGLRVRFRQL